MTKAQLEPMYTTSMHRGSKYRQKPGVKSVVVFSNVTWINMAVASVWLGHRENSMDVPSTQLQRSESVKQSFSSL